VLALGIFAAPIATAQQLPKPYRIGVLATTSWPPFDTFRQGLRDLGYVEGQNLAIEYHWAEGKRERFPELAARLVESKPDVIVTWGTPATQAAKSATQTIPIVMAAVSDPVGLGIVASLARPGSNITGLAAHNPELEGKRLELLKELVPKIRRVALLGNPAASLRPLFLTETQSAARVLGVQLRTIDVPTYDLEGAFAKMTKERTDAVVVAPDTVFVHHRNRLADLAARHRLPAVYLHTEHAHAGGLMAYGPSYHELFRRAASFVDKILKGTKPADLPVEQSMKFELVVNLKAAKALGLTIPQSILIRVDQMIE
jgi:putative ABC transport system substrate-binding protein